MSVRNDFLKKLAESRKLVENGVDASDEVTQQEYDMLASAVGKKHVRSGNVGPLTWKVGDWLPEGPYMETTAKMIEDDPESFEALARRHAYAYSQRDATEESVKKMHEADFSGYNQKYRQNGSPLHPNGEPDMTLSDLPEKEHASLPPGHKAFPVRGGAFIRGVMDPNGVVTGYIKGSSLPKDHKWYTESKASK